MKKFLMLALVFSLAAMVGYAAPQQDKPSEEKTLTFKFNKPTVEGINKALKETTVEYNLGVKAIDATKTWEAMFTEDKTEIEVKLKESVANAVFAGVDNSNASHNLCKTILQIMVQQAQPQLTTPPKKE